MLFVGVFKIKKFVPSTELWWHHKIFFKQYLLSMNFLLAENKKNRLQKAGFIF